jgi:hypothetical protein
MEGGGSVGFHLYITIHFRQFEGLSGARSSSTVAFLAV